MPCTLVSPMLPHPGRDTATAAMRSAPAMVLVRFEEERRKAEPPWAANLASSCCRWGSGVTRSLEEFNRVGRPCTGDRRPDGGGAMFSLFRNRSDDVPARLYATVVAQAREPALFLRHGVPDT